MSLNDRQFIVGEQFESTGGGRTSNLYEVTTREAFIKEYPHINDLDSARVVYVKNLTRRIAQFSDRPGPTLEHGRLHKCFRHL